MTTSANAVPQRVPPSSNPAGPLRSFEDLVAPHSVKTFFEEYWEKRYLYISRGDVSFYRDVFSLADVDRTIAARSQDSRDCLAIVPPADSPEAPVHSRPGALPMEQLYTSFNTGSTLRLQHVQEGWAPIALLTKVMEEALSAEVNVNFYLTPADSQGFNVHYDPHDVFILQTDGAKDWYIYEPDLDLPAEKRFYQTLPEVASYNLDESTARLVERVRLEAGDLLYLPRGVPHKAVTSGTYSLHLTMGVHPIYWMDFLQTAIERAGVETFKLRRSLAPGFLKDPEALERVRQEFVGMLRLAAEKADFEKTMNALVASRTEHEGYPADGHFAELADVQSVTLDRPLVRRTGMRSRVELEEGLATLKFARRTVGGPPAILDALEFVRDHERFMAAELPGLSDKSRLMLARRLIQEGFVRREGSVAGSPAGA